MEDKLKKLGFTEIQSLRFENRDDLYRMTWVGIIEDKFWTVLLVKKNNEWLIDRLTIDMDANRQMEKMCFDSPNPIEFILDLISKEQGSPR